MSPLARPAHRAAAAAVAWTLLGLGCARDAPRAPPASSTREALATLRDDLSRQLAELPSVPSGSAAERARLGELGARGRALLRRVRERPATLAPERLAPFLAPLGESGAPEVRCRRSTYRGLTYAIASRELATATGTIWLEIVDPAGSPELLTAFEIERAVGVRSTADGRFRARDLGSFPGVVSSLPRAQVRPGQVAETVQVLVSDRLLVAARATAGIDPATLTERVSRIDLEGLGRLAEEASAATSTPPVASPAERFDDG